MNVLISKLNETRWGFFEQELHARSLSNPSLSKLLECARATRKELRNKNMLPQGSFWGSLKETVDGGADGLRITARKQVSELLTLPLSDAVLLLESRAPEMDAGEFFRIEQELKERSTSSQVAAHLLKVAQRSRRK